MYAQAWYYSLNECYIIPGLPLKVVATRVEFCEAISGWYGVQKVKQMQAKKTEI